MKTMELDEGSVFFSEENATPRPHTGLVPGWVLIRGTDEVEFFDPTANEMFPVSPIGELKGAIDDWHADREADAESLADFEADPYEIFGVLRSDF